MSRAWKSIFDAVRTGSTEDVQRLLAAGTDPNVVDELGRKPLHCAVDAEHYEIAALLLAYGGSHLPRDAEGNTPLSRSYIDEEGLHRIRQLYLRNPDPCFMQRSTDDAVNTEALNSLKENGFARLDSLLDRVAVKDLERDFSGFIRALDEKLLRGEGRKKNYDEEEHFWVDEKAYVSNNAFKYSHTLLELASSRTLCGLANAYFGKPAHVQRAMAYRYLPGGAGGGMFSPHHDMQDKLLKVMILLTEIGDRDQYMVYYTGTHYRLRPYGNFFSNEVDIGSEAGTGIAHARGNPGDVILFDANGAHYARRDKDAPLRDVYILEYSADPAEVTGGTVAEVFTGGKEADLPYPLSRMSRTVPRWAIPFIRRRTSWVETLPFPGLWLLRSTGIGDACR